MTLYQRGLRYLRRKKGKSILLLLVLFFVCSLLLCTTMIQQAAQETEQALYDRTGTKLILRAQSAARLISDHDLDVLEQHGGFTGFNRSASAAAYPADFAMLQGNDSGKDANQQIMLTAYDNTEMDGPFAQQRYRLICGAPIKSDTSHAVLINSLLAEANGLEIGSALRFTSPEGDQTVGTVIGIYFSGLERMQEATIDARQRLENQIFVSFDLYEDLFDSVLYTTVAAYIEAPEKIHTLHAFASEQLGKIAEVTTSDALYQQMKAPLEQVVRVTRLMLGLTGVTGFAVVSLLLAMWMRTRKKEFAVLIGMGVSRTEILLQAVLESGILFLLSAAAAAGVCIQAADGLQTLLFSAQHAATPFEIRLTPEQIAVLLFAGGVIVFAAICISLIPIWKSEPRDILSQMED